VGALGFRPAAAGGVVTTVYTESSTKQVQYLLDDPDATGVVVENGELLERVLSVEDDLDLEFFVVMDASESDRDDVYSLGEVYELGDEAFDEEEYRGWLDARDTEDLASLIYTSGRPASPRGQTDALELPGERKPGPQATRPAAGQGSRTTDAHARDEDHLVPAVGPRLRAAGGSLRHVRRWGRCRLRRAPRHARGRPETTRTEHRCQRPARLRAHLRHDARAGAESGVKKRIFEWALGVAREWQRTEDPGPGLRAKHALADRLVYSTVKENIGGEIEFMVSGGGSLAKELCETFNGMGITIVEGYGLTETAPSSRSTHRRTSARGRSASPSTDRRAPGRVRRRRHRVRRRRGRRRRTPGPWPERHRWVLEPDGRDGTRVHRGQLVPDGDIVEQTDDGFLTYHDRIKEIIVLSTGKNVAPQPIEDAFSTNDRVDQIMVVGDERKFIGAILVPNFEALGHWADRGRIDPDGRRGALRGRPRETG